jgi:TonB family protein
MAAWLLCAGVVAAQGRLRVCVLDFGAERAGPEAAATLAQALATEGVTVNDRDESRAAARGAGYEGALNLSLDEARDLGGALGCDFYFLGRVATQDQATLARPVWFEAYAALLLVNGRTGRLVRWEIVAAEAVRPEHAAAQLPAQVAAKAKAYVAAMREAAAEDERAERARLRTDAPRIEDAPDADSPGLRLPAPYRRVQPVYPEAAARVGAAGTVDVLAELDAAGEVKSVEVVRWAGFGLDEATAETVRRMRFRPAQRDGQAVPLRVLLRYNFRPKTP